MYKISIKRSQQTFNIKSVDTIIAIENRGKRGIQGIQGEPGLGIPAGGTDGQVLVKDGVTDFDVEWFSLTTANIPDSANARYVTDAQLAVLAVTSGVNTGDQDLSPYLTIASAAATYLTIANAASTYLSIADAAATYITLSQIAAQYLKLDASNDPITGDLAVKPSVDSATAFVIKDSADLSLAVFDTLNKAITINQTSTTVYSAATGNIPGTMFIQNPQSLDNVFTGINFRTNNTAAGIQRAYLGIYSTPSGQSPVMVFGRRTATSVYAETIRFDENGNVGINTITPLTKLTVLDTVSTSPRGILSMQISTNTSGARVGFSKARGVLGTETTVVTGDTLGRMVFRGHDGTSYLEMGSIEVVSTGTIATSRIPTYMTFSTATDASPSVMTERVRIDSAGLVGIGTALPTSNLSFDGLTAKTIGLERNTVSNTAGNDLTIKAGGTTSGSTDKAGGVLFLTAGLSTGTGRSAVAIGGYIPGSTGTTDATLNSSMLTVFATSATAIFVNIGLGNTTTGNPIGGNSFNVLGTQAGGVSGYRNTIANTAGNSFTVQAAGATSGATDKSGGSVVIKGGISTGVGNSSVQIFTAAPTSTGAVATISLNAGGTGYTAGDTLTLVGGNNDATVTVSTVDGSGVILTIALNAAGTNYGTSNAYSVTGGTGSGAKINILTLTSTADSNPASRFVVSGEGKITSSVTIRDISGTQTGFSYTPAFTTPVSSAAAFRTFNLGGVIGADSSAVEAYTGSFQGVHQEFEVRTSGLIGSIVGAELNAMMTRTSGAATAQATTVLGLQVNGFSKPSGGSVTVTITNLTGIAVNLNAGANLTATTLTGIKVQNPSASGTFTTMYGIDIEALTRAATTNIGLRIALPSGATTNYALQLSDTTGVAAGGITFGTDVQLYRSAADTLKTDDKLLISTGADATVSNLLQIRNPGATVNTGGQISLETGAGTVVANIKYIRTGTNTGDIYFETNNAASITEKLRIKSSGELLIAEAGNLQLGTTTGTKIGTGVTQKLGFWNVTPVVQPASANQAALTNSTGGAYDATLVDVGIVFSQANINNNFTDIYTLLTDIRTALVNTGIIKGSA